MEYWKDNQCRTQKRQKFHPEQNKYSEIKKIYLEAICPTAKNKIDDNIKTENKFNLNKNVKETI